MKLKSILSNKDGQLDVNIAVAAILGLVLAASFLVIGIVVLQGVTDNVALTEAVSATGTFTFTGVGVDAVNQSINISTETYTIVNISNTGSLGQYYVYYNGTTNDAANLTANLTAEINLNSSLVTAVDGGSNDVTVTSAIAGTAGNAYATTENITNGGWGAETLTGGTAADEMRGALNSIVTSIESAMALAGTLLLVIIGVAILMLLAGVMVIMKMFR